MTNAEISKLSYLERQKLLKERLGGGIAKMYNIEVEKIVETPNQKPIFKPPKDQNRKQSIKQKENEGEEKKPNHARHSIELPLPLDLLIKLEVLARKKGMNKQKYMLKLLETDVNKNEDLLKL